MSLIPVYILILFFTILVDYFAARSIEKSKGQKRKLILVVSIVANLSVLGLFKYFNFFNDNIGIIAERVGWNYSISSLKIILPVGLSFHTFQSLSYTIEVYRGNFKAENHLGIFALYVMFYPQLVAGPIERPQHLLHQFHEKHHFDYDRFRSGSVLMVWGLMKKTVIADRLSTVVNQVYGNPMGFSGLPLILATVFFSIQIYCDFSGYSDIARGCARVMGFSLMENFRSPYLSGSVSEFWKRWHISLSTWFRDYLYFPLGGNRVARPRWIFNLFITFVLSGLWHGANWTFVIWGGLHGVFVVVSHLIEGANRNRAVASHQWFVLLMGRWGRVFLTYVAVCFAWIFFRANNLHDANYIVSHLFQNIFSPLSSFMGRLVFLPVDWILLAFLIPLLLMAEAWMEKKNGLDRIFQKSGIVRWGFYGGMIYLIVIFGVFHGTQFIYFQF